MATYHLRNSFALQVARLFTQFPRISLFRPLAYLIRATTSFAIPPTRFHVIGEGGLRLQCIRLQTPTPIAGRLPVIFIHGYGETKERRLRIASLFLEQGHDVLMPDLRAHGQSQGLQTTFGVMERHDLTAMIDEAQRRGWIPDAKVIAAGLSLGGAVVLQHAPLDTRVDRVVAIAPFVTAAAAVESYRRKYFWFFSRQFAQLAFELESARAGWRLQDASTLDAIARIKVPVLLVVGDRDTNLDIEHHTRPLAQTNAAAVRELYIVPGANHFNVLNRRWPGLDRKIAEFCR